MKERFVLTVICIFTVIIIAVLSLDCGDLLSQAQVETSENLLVIDPGHGGMDGGAVSADGVAEKDLNLAIAMHLQNLAQEYGWQVLMTREDDRWLADSEEGSIRSRKTQDLRNRCRIIRTTGPEVAVSIHLNSFVEDTSVRGIQVFYPENPNDECKRFAETLQNHLNKMIQPERPRSAMVRKDVMLFREAVCPTVIIECGFLSNPREAQLLQKDEYQQQIAAGIMDGITEFTGREMPANVEIIDSLR